MAPVMKRHASSGFRVRGDIYLTWIDQDRRAKKRRGRKGEEPGGVPVEPNRPSTLSGGAAAALEFDE
jgi:hypothetical protein